MTKAEEKLLLQTIVLDLPDGYAKSILADLLPEMNRAIDSDFVYIPFQLRAQQNEEHRQDILKARKELDQVRAEIANKERLMQTLDAAIQRIRADIKQYANL